MKNIYRAIAVLIGTTIGAGIFGIPYVVSKIGFFPGIFYILILGGLVLILNLIYGEIILRTRGDHQLTGYSEIYLGKIGKKIASIALFIGLYGALLAYLIKIGEFASLIFGIGNPVLFSLIFFIFALIAIFFGLRTVSFLEGLIVVFILGLIFLIAVLGFNKIDLVNFTGLDLSYLFLPFGVILFALTGFSVIPEMEEILRDNHKNLKKSIIIGSLIPVIVYVLFVIVIIGIGGQFTSDDAISGLVLFLPAWIVYLGAVFGILCMASSFLALSYVLKEVWHRDFKLPKTISVFLACFPSLVLFLLGAKSFIQVLSITGAISGSLAGILIIAIFTKAKKIGKRTPAYFLNLPKILILFLFLVFLIGIFSPFL